MSITPGPWEWTRSLDDAPYVPGSFDAVSLWTVQKYFPDGRPANPGDEGYERWDTLPRQILYADEPSGNAADMFAIAAVPELLAALQSALETAEFERHPFRPWHNDARAALAKASPPPEREGGGGGA